MKGFAFFAVAIAALSITASFSFLNYFTASSPEIDAAVARLRLPSDVAYELSRFEDPQRRLTSFLKAAWENAEEGRRLSKELYKIELSFSLEGAVDAVKAALGLKVQERRAELFSRLDAAYKAAWDSLLGVLHLAEEALTELDEWGADNENYSGIAHENYLRARAVFSRIEDVFTGKITASNCEGAVNKTFCLLRKASTSDLGEKVSVFNELVGRPGAALVDDYYAVHGVLRSARAAMLEEVAKMRREYQEKSEQLENRLRGLEAEDPGVVNSRVVQALSKTQRVLLTAGSGSDFPAFFQKIRRNADAARLLFQRAEWVYAGRLDDRVFRALEKMVEAVRLLETSLSQAESLEAELKGLKAQADAFFGNRADSPTVLDLVNEAASEKSAGKALARYAKAAEFLYLNESAPAVLDYLEKAVRGADGFADLSEEKAVLASLKQLPLSAETIASAFALEQKLRLKTRPVLQQVEELRNRAEGLFQASIEMSAVFPKEFEGAGIAETGRLLERLALLDAFSNAGRLYEEYMRIVETLSPLIDKTAAAYLKKEARLLLAFTEPAVCGKQAAAVLSVSVRNSLPAGLPASGFYADYGPDAVYTHLPALAPGEEKTLSFNVLLTPAFCTVEAEVLQADEHETRWLMSIKVSASTEAQVMPPVLLMPVERRMVRLDWDGGSLSKKLFEITGPVISVERQKQEFAETRGFRVVKTLTMRSNASVKNVLIKEPLSPDATSVQASISFKRAGPYAFFSIPALETFEEKQVTLSYLTSTPDQEAGLPKPFFEASLNTAGSVPAQAADAGLQKQASSAAGQPFDAVHAHKKIEALKKLLTLFKKATDADETLSTDGLIFSREDHSEARAWLARVEKTKNNSFFAEAVALEEFLNNSVSSLKTLAREAVRRAVSDAEAGGDRKSLQFAARAKQAFMQGEYSKASQYAHQVPEQREQPAPPPLVYLAAVAPLLALAFFMLRRPEKPKALRPVKTVPGGDLDD